LGCKEKIDKLIYKNDNLPLKIILKMQLKLQFRNISARYRYSSGFDFETDVSNEDAHLSIYYNINKIMKKPLVQSFLLDYELCNERYVYVSDWCGKIVIDDSLPLNKINHYEFTIYCNKIRPDSQSNEISPAQRSNKIKRRANDYYYFFFLFFILMLLLFCFLL